MPDICRLIDSKTEIRRLFLCASLSFGVHTGLALALVGIGWMQATDRPAMVLETGEVALLFDLGCATDAAPAQPAPAAMATLPPLPEMAAWVTKTVSRLIPPDSPDTLRSILRSVIPDPIESPVNHGLINPDLSAPESPEPDIPLEPPPTEAMEDTPPDAPIPPVPESLEIEETPELDSRPNWPENEWTDPTPEPPPVELPEYNGPESKTPMPPEPPKGNLPEKPDSIVLETSTPSLEQTPQMEQFAGGDHRERGVTQRAEPIYGFSIRYPERARQRGQSGSVLVSVWVDAEGMSRTVTVERSSGYPDLDIAALTAVRNARFRPARRNGRPVAGQDSFEIEFRLEERRRR